MKQDKKLLVLHSFRVQKTFEPFFSENHNGPAEFLCETNAV
jgi:hypothetical protein